MENLAKSGVIPAWFFPELLQPSAFGLFTGTITIYLKQFKLKNMQQLIRIEAYSLAHGLRAGDAIIAATAAENNMLLVTSNAKHFKPIQGLKLKAFKP